MKQTGNLLDIAISGDGYFLVRRDDQYFLTRSGRFSRDAEGVLRNAEGLVLQFSDGADAATEGGAVEILNDGTVLDQGAAVGRIGVYAAPGGAAGRAGGGLLPVAGEPAEVDEGAFEVRQGMLESSNVVLSDEMVALMANTRQAEGAAQLVRTYDQLVGQAITTFARAGR